jgi:hypothetical protein
MTTEKQIAANRANAQESTGPRTAVGKAASSANALKSGIYAKFLLIPTPPRRSPARSTATRTTSPSSSA